MLWRRDRQTSLENQQSTSCNLWKKRKLGNINSSILQISKRQRAQPSFINNYVINESYDDVNESYDPKYDSLQGEELIDLLYDADDKIEIELTTELNLQMKYV